jgi:hypothetical protein
MADLLDAIRAELRTRLEELRPLVSEYQRLQDAETALGDGSQPRRTSPRRARRAATQPPRARQRRASTRRRPSVAVREANREKVVALVGARPGITKAELRDAAGLSGAGVAQNLRRLLDRGELRQEALPGGQIGFRLGGSDAEQASDGADGAAARKHKRARGDRSRRPAKTTKQGRRATSREANENDDGGMAVEPGDRTDRRGDAGPAEASKGPGPG